MLFPARRGTIAVLCTGTLLTLVACQGETSEQTTTLDDETSGANLGESSGADLANGEDAAGGTGTVGNVEPASSMGAASADSEEPSASEPNGGGAQADAMGDPDQMSAGDVDTDDDTSSSADSADATTGGDTTGSPEGSGGQSSDLDDGDGGAQGEAEDTSEPDQMGAGGSSIDEADPCGSSSTVFVTGVGFDAFNGIRVRGFHEATQLLCPGGHDDQLIEDGSFSLSMTAETGIGSATLYLDLDDNGEHELHEPDWTTFDDASAARTDWEVTPADFDAVTSLRLQLTGLPADFEGFSGKGTVALCGPEVVGLPPAEPSQCERTGLGVVRDAAVDQVLRRKNGFTQLFIWVPGGGQAPQDGDLTYVGSASDGDCQEDGSLSSCMLDFSAFTPYAE